MIVSLEKINELETFYDLNIESEKILLEDEFAKLKTNVNISGLLSKKEEIIRFEGKLQTAILLICDRCLTETEKDFFIEIDERFVDKSIEILVNEKEITEEDLNVSVLESNTFDFSEVAREQLLLQLATHFVCQENCQGLCQTCKANKNIEDCNCNQKEIDPRWSALKNLVK